MICAVHEKLIKVLNWQNPHLKPEYVTTYETGSNYKPIKNILEGSVYFSYGKDFQYFVATGEVIDNTSIVLKRENIGDVNIKGFEITLKYQILKILY